MIARFIFDATTGGDGSVIVRALGPSLGGTGVSDPVLPLHDGNGTVIATNDNWQSTQAVAIQATGVPPPNPLEAAIVATLAPGNYTAIESGKDGGTGIGLIEVITSIRLDGTPRAHALSGISEPLKEVIAKRSAQRDPFPVL